MCDMEKSTETLGISVVGARKIWIGILASAELGGNTSLTSPWEVEQRENI